ncbi:MAG TPA: fused MFS/spermidine synthase [Bryobacteraceae bacterium]|nr:fused MFS/spermidine synthase [Bryobacteraceae bacterium]
MSKAKLKRPLNAAPVEASEWAPPALRRYLPFLLVLFAGSGCAALIYEVVWFQLLQLVIGSSAISLGVLLATYMGGMCLGSLLLPRLVSSREHPLRVYALIEGGIGICGVLVLFGVPLLDHAYAAIAGHGAWGIVLRAVLAAICLLPPTLLMGASLPAIARWIEATPEGVSWLGYFYGGNIAGAVFGCLLAGFYLLRVHDMAVATWVAVAVNIAVSVLSFRLSEKTEYTPQQENVLEAPSRAEGAMWVYITIGISGLCALGAEVIWTRLLSVMIGATVYTFSIILAVFLTGLGLGSAVGAHLSRGKVRPKMALAACQMLLAVAIAWTAYVLADALPNWPVNPLIARSAWFNFEMDLMRVSWAIFPAACLWGASFPFALAAIAGRGEDSGKLVGEVYAANTVGGILGALAFSIVLIPAIGSQDSQRVLITLAAAAAWGLWLTAWESLRGGAKFAAVAATLLVAMLIATVSEVPWLAIAYGRRMTITQNAGRALYVGEGRNSSIAISELPDGKHYFHVAGKVEASTEPYDMRLQLMLGHVPALFHPDPKSVLVVGFGAGVTAGTFVLHPQVQKITICELEPLIPPAATRYFRRENNDVMHDGRTQIFYDDARHFILTSKDKYDIITSDPIHPWVKGTSSLYSKEYFELVKQHLNPGGIVTQWVPLYESDFQTIKTELATFFDAFPNGTIWGNDINGEGYDVVLMGQVEPAKIQLDAIDDRLAREPAVKESMRPVGLDNALSILTTYAGRAPELAAWLAGATINDDMNLRLQYLAGMGLNFDQPGEIYNQILQFRKFPADIFSGSEARLTALRFALGGGSR